MAAYECKKRRYDIPDDQSLQSEVDEANPPGPLEPVEPAIGQDSSRHRRFTLRRRRSCVTPPPARVSKREGYIVIHAARSYLRGVVALYPN